VAETWWHIERLYAFASIYGLGLSSSARVFGRLKHCHAGKRAFVIGNGPSLRMSDLEKLTGEITFASNRIFVCFNETLWRPMYYATGYEKICREFLESVDGTMIKCIFAPEPKALDEKYSGDSREKQQIAFINQKWRQGDYDFLHFSYLPNFQVFTGGTVTYILMQLAFFMGIRELYLLGVDCNYNISEAKQRSKTVLANGNRYVMYEVEDARDDHFHKDYHAKGELASVPDIQMHLKAYRLAKEVYETHGGRIINLSRGGELDVFERGNFDEVVSAKRTEGGSIL
jgi:hypothetical protein